MSRNALILERATSPKPSPAALKAAPSSGEYRELVARLFSNHSVVAVVESGSGSRAPEACRGIAAELAATGKRVVIVRVETLLRTDPLPEATACQSTPQPNVSLWPSMGGAPVEFYQSPAPFPSGGHWLGVLRRNFDSVVMDCPAVDSSSSAAGIAAMADAAVLIVEAGRTTREQIQHDQRALQLSGIKLEGSILMRRR